MMTTAAMLGLGRFSLNVEKQHFMCRFGRKRNAAVIVL
jgi:hypothetical protein